MSHEGLAGVTLGRIAEEAGMSKSGIFAHFRSKEEVELGLLKHLAQSFDSLIVEPVMQAPEGLPRLQALVDLWFGWSARAGLPGGCPVAAAMFEIDDVEGPVRERVQEMERRWRGFLRQRVDEAVSSGHLRQNLDAKQFVWELCGIYLGHHVAQRFLRDAQAGQRADTAFRALLDRAGAASPKLRKPGASSKRIRP